MFKGFSDNTIKFFIDLRFNNNAEFFHSHKAEYDAVKAEFSAFIDAISNTVLNVDSSIDIRPSRCLSRIRRDTRFSKDKTPYRDHLWFLFRRNHEQREGAPLFWFELSPEVCVWGVGVWGNYKPFFNTFRKELLDKPKEFESIISKTIGNTNYFKVEGPNYKKLAVPSSIPSSLYNYYTKKELYISHNIDNYSDVFGTKLVEQFSNDILKLAPLYNYFRRIADMVLIENEL